MFQKLFCLLILCGLVYADTYTSTQPQQIHISYGFQPNDIAITWSTFKPTNTSIVQYTANYILYDYAKGYQTKFVNGNKTQYIHRVLLTDLDYSANYFYQVGDYLGGWSKTFNFNTPPASNQWKPRLAIYGDMGLENDKSLPYLKPLVQSSKIDAIIHNGDFAYDMHEKQGEIGDKFMNQIESIAAYVPYMTSVGNHEQYNNYSNYKNRFTMPSINNENFYYNFTMGDACFVAYSTEFYFTDIKEALVQFEWLNKTLQEQTCPWVIAFGHRPMYCSNNNHDDCTKVMGFVRMALENLFYDNHVDIVLEAHEHSFEATTKIFNDRIDPKGIYHIISGSAGCREDHDPFTKKVHPWSIFRSDDYGYGIMEVVNSTHIYYQQMSVDQNPAKIIFSKWYTK
jgi:hypothetical protein